MSELRAVLAKLFPSFISPPPIKDAERRRSISRVEVNGRAVSPRTDGKKPARASGPRKEYAKAREGKTAASPSADAPEADAHSSLQSDRDKKFWADVKFSVPPEVFDLIENTKNLTAPGGDLELPSEQQKQVAIFDNGVALIARGLKATGEVKLALEMARRVGKPVQITEEVDQIVLARLRQMIEGAQNRSARAGEVQQRSREEKEVLELFRQASLRRTSDIHITIREEQAVIEFRAGGDFYGYQKMEALQATRLWKAAFAMADAGDSVASDIGYQDGRITARSARMTGPIQSIRVQVNPLANGGRYIVMRLLYKADKELDDSIEGLGYDEDQINAVLEMMAKPYGVTIVAGPTGSGKSTTLQRVLSRNINEAAKKDGLNVVTVEDPPEYEIPGAKQMPVSEAKTADQRKAAFRQAINAAMRSDPDDIMIGEIRDKESGDLAMEAAMTGHGVYATVHATDAMRITDRLIDLGIEPYKVLDPEMIIGLIAQRLVKTLCKECSIPIVEARRKGLVEDELWARVCEAAGPKRDKVKVRGENKACPTCGGRGTKGRTVVAETIVPDHEFMDALKRKDRRAARDHWVQNLRGLTMIEHAKRKMCSGILDPYEVESVVERLVENWHLRKTDVMTKWVGDVEKTIRKPKPPDYVPPQVDEAQRKRQEAVDLIFQKAKAQHAVRLAGGSAGEAPTLLGASDLSAVMGAIIEQVAAEAAS